MLIIADKLMSADIEKHSVSDSSSDILSGKVKKSLQIFDKIIEMNCREIQIVWLTNLKKWNMF